MTENRQTRSTSTKIAIVGAGAVGTAVAYSSLIRGVARTVALLDINKAKVTAEVLDLSHGLEFVPRADIIGDDDVAVCAGADVVVFTAGAKQKPGQSRLELAEATIGLTKKILPGLLDVAPDAIYVMVTNPVDIVTYAALKFSGLPRNQLFGSGTVLDSSRLRFLLSQYTGVAPQNVHAYIAGEHGDSEIPLWTSATIGAVPLLEWEALPGYQPLDEAARRSIHHDVVHAAYKIIEGKGATNYAIGLAATRIVEAILKDEHRILPVSTVAEGFAGLDDVCLSLPAVVGRSGCGRRLDVKLSDDERAGLLASAQTLREMQAGFGL
ncbi:L-lactate dehydrogenase [Gordonia sp. (in: high G+C Gram-positive bacteria)]|jgi:L-lactate dehydrogenase|uniref:L-lactate dehydrogenase n=2 Tax=Gordonia sp. (in: high G+C Gram-positive bacteria) TaxID=84139 RepID=UPI00261FFCC5|nr:L-lactate dehydrogenase [Gordonia sp. (in: high G+C Gram-positive bacteria)]HMS77225.1 L-lactate dehydrogenase [Gordonia sp. (in: high G+C Gram-positive bacteria)]HQV18355.1 L-lactate dehydrogenase [Gordonia sp. (in: high G+C Gram-positive bacteria)]